MTVAGILENCSSTYLGHLETLAGSRQAVSLPDDLQNLPDLPDSVDRLIRQIPVGKVTTYGSLARALGDPIASRWVGHYLLHHDHGPACPCHRVVRAGGELGRYADESPGSKAQRLIADGVDISGDRVPLDRFEFDAFETTRPLIRLARLQAELAARIGVTPPPSTHPARVAGVDVSYRGDVGNAAYVECDSSSGEVRRTVIHRRAVRFPYISSYLAFRELPLLVELLDRVRSEHSAADVILVDGSGTLHPRRAGLASLLGVVCDVTTIGVTKKLLYGRLDQSEIRPCEPTAIHDDRGQLVGFATRSRGKSRRPIFLSPGHAIDLTTTWQVVSRCLMSHSLPEPIYWADRISRQAK